MCGKTLPNSETLKEQIAWKNVSSAVGVILMMAGQSVAQDKHSFVIVLSVLVGFPADCGLVFGLETFNRNFPFVRLRYLINQFFGWL